MSLPQSPCLGRAQICRASSPSLTLWSRLTHVPATRFNFIVLPRPASGTALPSGAAGKGQGQLSCQPQVWKALHQYHHTADKRQGFLSTAHAIGADYTTNYISRASATVLPWQDVRPALLSAGVGVGQRQLSCSDMLWPALLPRVGGKSEWIDISPSPMTQDDRKWRGQLSHAHSLGAHLQVTLLYTALLCFTSEVLGLLSQVLHLLCCYHDHRARSLACCRWRVGMGGEYYSLILVTAWEMIVRDSFLMLIPSAWLTCNSYNQDQLYRASLVM